MGIAEIPDIKRKLYNLSELTRAVLGKPPSKCHAVRLKRPNPYCEGCKPGDAFLCPVCNRLTPWCMGMTDEYENICDNCWVVANQMELEAHGENINA